MESFVHLRKGKTPRRLHADLDGLKDDELGRGGFTGRTANIYRRHDPTAYRSVGPLRPVDVLSSELKPSDATDANGGPLLMFSNADCRILLSRRHEPMPFYTRHVDGDLLCFVHQGAGLVETEFGPLRYREGDWVYIPKACTWRQVPDSETTLLDDRGHRRVPRAAARAAGPPLPLRPVAGHHPRPGRPSTTILAEAATSTRSGLSTKVARQRCSTNTIRSTSKAGAVTTSRSPSTSPTTTSSPPTVSTCRRRCICSCRPPAST